MHDTHRFVNMTSSYKQEHENFMTGHSGTTYLEVAVISSIICIACFLRDLFILSDFRRIIRSRLLIDMVLLVLPSIGVTVLNSYIGLFLFVLLFASITLYCHIRRTSGHSHSTALTLDQVNLSNKKTFITYFRSVINLSTAVAILAVDFPVFPRRLAKSETYGFGGMDTGVGFFVVSNAIVSHEARGKGSALPAWHQLKEAVVSSLPLLILGFARLLTVKGADYHEHITEYGVHWNFFFTLAALKMLLTMIYCILPVRCSAVGATAVMIGHQTLLSNGLSSYIINGSDGAGGRSGCVDANREGICSLLGYIAIYMYGVHLGRSFFKQRQNLKDWLVAAKSLAVKFAVFTLVMIIFHWAVEPVSRRLANAAFAFWVLSLSSLMILELMLADIFITYIIANLHDAALHDQDKTIEHFHRLASYDNQELEQRNRSRTGLSSADGGGDTAEYMRSRSQTDHYLLPEVCLLDAISFNSLLFFLLANLLTGAVNMSYKTIYASDPIAVVTLVLYMFTLSFVVVALRKRNICTKIW